MAMRNFHRLLISILLCCVGAFNPVISTSRCSRLWNSGCDTSNGNQRRVIPTNSTIGVSDLATHISILDTSLKKLTGQSVYERMGLDERTSTYKDICENERYILLSHNTEDDPIYNFGNIASLNAFHRTWDEVCIMPSRESVVLLSKDEKLRVKLMQKVTDEGFVEGATGIRVRGDGKFIRLVDAVVWNCYDDEDYYGQAVCFDLEKAEILTDVNDD